MKNIKIYQLLKLVFIPIIITGCQKDVKNIERPEKIVSKRQVIYDQQTYSKLADLWENYYDEFPSEDAYANWMYAARYSGLPNYESLLTDGINKYPANPTLLYLKALIKHGKKDDLESIHFLERAVKLDPTFIDPWFGLVVDYMGNGDQEKSDSALRKLLTENAINDEVMDYNFNVITLLEKNAILITNGDNDTYPGWIITRILNYRPDVRIVNRSLLNTEWYPIHLIKNDEIPNFITQNELSALRENISNEIKKGNKTIPSTGPFGDTLITYLANSAQENNRPVYLAATLYKSDVIKNFMQNGINLGLVTKVAPIDKEYPNLIKGTVNKWLGEFRTGGLTSWQLKYGKKTSAGKWLVTNYGEAIKSIMEPVIQFSPDRRLELFHWYKNYILDLLPKNKIDNINSSWCKSIDIKEINEWCKTNNYL